MNLYNQIMQSVLQSLTIHFIYVQELSRKIMVDPTQGREYGSKTDLQDIAGQGREQYLKPSTSYFCSLCSYEPSTLYRHRKL